MSAAKRFVFSKKTFIVGIIATVAMLACITAVLLVRQNDEAKRTQAEAGVIDTPNYATVLPAGKSISTLGGWTRISPPENDPVYAYTDKIGDLEISVSQQSLPASFKNNVDTQVAEMAKSFNATTEIEAGDTKVYIGTSANGPQSVIFTKNSLLILIKSQEKVENNDWLRYIESLN